MLLSLIKKDLLLTWKYILLMAALCCFYPLFILHNLKGEAAAYAGSLSFSVMTLFAVLFSLFVSIAANLIMNSYVGAWIVSLNAVVYVCCFAASVAVGIGSGLLPSLQAANLDPVESLRNE